MKAPKVSICIPAYNQVEYLRKTLDSVLQQDYADYEIIVTDDSKGDSVKTLVNSYDFENRLKYFKNEISLGSPQNWNKAVEKASGEYIKMLHHDDFFTFPYSLAKYVELLEKNPNIDFAFSAAVAVNITENRTWVHSATMLQLDKLKENPQCLFFGNFIGPPSSTIYRNNKELKYDSNLKWIVDIDFYIQCLSRNKNFIFSEEPLITSISGALHNITNDCIDNKDVQLFEYLYLFDKLSHGMPEEVKEYVTFFNAIFSKYNVKSIKEIKEAGFSGKIPLFVKRIIFNIKIRNVFNKK